MTADLEDAVSPLFVPADRPERIDKALASTADAVIVDLEDAVSPDAKDSARDTLAAWLAEHPKTSILIRINPVGDTAHEADLALCRAHDNIAAIVLPKAESAAAVSGLDIGDMPLWALIETPAGVLAAADIAAAPTVMRLAFGALDFAAATGLDADHVAGTALLNQARGQLVLASAAAGLAPPLDSPQPVFRDSEPVARAAEHAAAMGFGGALAIHPAQLDAIRAAFTPSAETRDWARRIVTAAEDNGTGAAQLDGVMIDSPVIKRARRVLDIASRFRSAG
ncbi:CoA ester lyase [uncultured Salinisphaera sp.]|uniref:HpcH/HpaI aldolase/citrate lyase family protein n=1 Tax=uncultured Salinisphaera sp. TaxID=359372 RepID=UPI0032B2264D|tara:strand:+ start:349 stop:1191 length:843 start_codon:yes stop_codon:yes gene_type:complete